MMDLHSIAVEPPISTCKMRCEAGHAGRADDKNNNDNSVMKNFPGLLY
jgi:hypothetical protein